MPVTRDVPPEAVGDLFRAAPRGCLAVVVDGRTRLVPVRATGDARRLEVECDEGAAPVDGADVQVVLDDGIAWWELRAVAVRGALTRLGPGRFALAPRRVVCWDYGALRPVDAPPPPAVRSPHGPPDGSGAVDATDDAWTFVRRSRVLLLGTTSAGRMPFVTPIWFVPGRGRVLHVSSGASSWAGRNLATHPEVSVLLGGERGRRDARRLLLDGTARTLPGLPPAASMPGLVARYYAAPRCAAVELAHRHQWPLRTAYYRQHSGPVGHLDVTVTRARFVNA